MQVLQEMKSESGPLKYRLARRYIGKWASLPVYEYVLQGWFEIAEYGSGPTDPPTLGGEWRPLDTIDID